jgi:hypothetical protein
MVQKAAQHNGRRRRGQSTAQGRQNQIASRLNHGIRSRSPVLLHVESSAEWKEHLEGFRQSYAPVGEVEECLVHLIAYQFWRWIGRLIPYERDLTFAKMVRPKDELGLDGVSAEVIQEVLTKSEEELRAPLSASQARLVRYEALENETSELVFTKAEVQELFGWLVDRIEEGTDSETEDEDDQDEADPDEGDEASDEAPDFNVEDRPWSVADVQSQLGILCDAVGRSWREELEWFLYSRKEKLNTRLKHLAKAKAHIERKRILSFEEVNRLALYERQINAVLKSLINQLERHQARRQGEPVAAPLALDLTVSSNERSVQSEVP